jgi:hypothetical protein
MSIETQIQALAEKYATQLQEKIETRVHEMELDDTSHYLIYQVLGIQTIEGKKIDEYQNKQFLYKLQSR